MHAPGVKRTRRWGGREAGQAMGAAAAKRLASPACKREPNVAERRRIAWLPEPETRQKGNEWRARRQQGTFLSTVFPVL